MVLYRYPKDPVESTLEEAPDYMSFDELFTQFYTDRAGLRWGNVCYYIGTRGSWVCLDDPMNEELNTEIVSVSPSAAQLRGSETVTAGPSVLLIVGVLVAGVVAVTVVLLLKRNHLSKDD